MLSKKTILITGGSGFLGRGLVEDLISKYDGVKIRVYSRSEHKQLEMEKLYGNDGIDYLLGDVRDRRRLKLAMKGADIVIHCAALKCIEKGQSDPLEFFKTNAVGAMNVIDCAIELGTERVIGVSTDKACGSVSNVYGSTKLISDLMFQAANNYNKNGNPKFIVVRYGNVIGSTGSVVPLWKRQVEAGEPITITNGYMTRFLITLKQAVDFILYKCMNGEPGEIAIPNIKACSIYELSFALFPYATRKIIGTRPGERDFEELTGTNGSYHSDEAERFTQEELKEMLNEI